MTLCEYCDSNCCKHKELAVNVNALDLAKIISIIECTFESIHPKNRGFGHVKHKGKTLIEIMEKPIFDYGHVHWTPIAYILNPCNFLKENGTCELHYTKIKEGSSTARILNDYSRSIKPMVCRHHPKFYDIYKRKVMKYEPCHILDDDHIIEANQETEIIKESKMVEKIQTTLYKYYLLTGNYPIYELSENINKWKKKNPIKSLEQKINELIQIKNNY